MADTESDDKFKLELSGYKAISLIKKKKIKKIKKFVNIREVDPLNLLKRCLMSSSTALGDAGSF